VGVGWGGGGGWGGVTQVSFVMPEYTGQVDGMGTLRLLEAVRTAGLGDSVRFYQVRIVVLWLPPKLLSRRREENLI
jgi:hypothetical protein